MQETYLTDLITLADGLPIAMLPFFEREKMRWKKRE